MGCPRLSAEFLDRMPRLRTVFHAAGSIRSVVSDAFWDRNITITSAAVANAEPVARFTVAQILAANKSLRRYAQLTSVPTTDRGWVNDPRLGNTDRTIGIVGFSRIGQRVLDILDRIGGYRVLVVDPYARAAAVAELGAELLPLHEVLPQVDVLSIHAPALPTTRNLLGRAELAALPIGCTVINTARGSLIDHEALLTEASNDRISAVFDVTEPEPLPQSSPLLTAPNVTITPHLAGAVGTERRLLLDHALDQLERFSRGDRPYDVVRRTDLDSIA